MIIGVIGFQGDVSEHIDILRKINRSGKFDVEVREIRRKEDLEGISGLIIPGGESTTIYKLIRQYGIYEEIMQKVREGMPVMGTCAGIILLSSETGDERVKGMGLLYIVIERNAYGRQVNSFIDDVEIKGVGKYKAVFIRAPVIEKCGKVDIISSYRDDPVMVRNNNVLGLTFHPELTGDTRVHEYFLRMIGGEGSVSTGD